MELNGSEIIVECLKEQKTDTIFGYPGGAILNVYDALYKHSDEITHILTSHEQGASHAADGYARATGKVGVCFATSGPGATNLVTGIATAYMDSVPMVAITCNVTVPLLGKDSFQEIDITGVTMPITKHNFIVKDVTKLADTIRKAFQIAKEGRPGPVLIDVTKDVTANSCEYVKKEPEAIVRITDTIKQKDIDNAISLIKEAKKPYVFVGGGVMTSDASDELRRFVKKIMHRLQIRLWVKERLTVLTHYIPECLVCMEQRLLILVYLNATFLLLSESDFLTELRVMSRSLQAMLKYYSLTLMRLRLIKMSRRMQV